MKGGHGLSTERTEHKEHESTAPTLPPRRSLRRNRKPKENSFFGGVAVLSFGIMVVKLIGMFYKIPLGEKIGNQGYADFNNAYSIYAVLLTISTAGLPVAVSKMISEASTQGNEAEVQKIFQVSLKFFLTLGSISFIIMYFFSETLAEMVNDSLAAPSIRALAPAVIFVSGVSAFRGYFQGRGVMTPTAVSQIMEALCKLIIGLSLATAIMNLTFTQEHLERFRPELDFTTFTQEEIDVAVESTQASQAAAGAIVGVTAGTAMALAFLLFHYFTGNYRRRSRKSDETSSEKDIMKTLLSIAIPITITSSMASFLSLIDGALVQGQLQNALALTENESRTIYGNYSLAVNIYNLPISLVTAVTVSVIPIASGALAKREKKRVATIAISALRMTGLLAIPMGVGLYVLGTPIIALLYPSADLEMSGKLLSTLGIVSSFVCLSLVSTSILQVYGFFHLPILITATGSIIKVIANFVLVGQENIGIYGAPLGYLFCFTFCFSLSFWILQRIVPGLAANKFMFVKPMIAAVGMGATAWATYGILEHLLLRVDKFVDETTNLLTRSAGGIATLISIALAALIYFILIFALGAVSREDVLMMPKGEKLAKILPVK